MDDLEEMDDVFTPIPQSPEQRKRHEREVLKWKLIRGGQNLIKLISFLLLVSLVLGSRNIIYLLTDAVEYMRIISEQLTK